MSNGSSEVAERAFQNHDAFEPVDNGLESAEDRPESAGDGHALTTTQFDAIVTADPVDQEGRDARFEVRVGMPTLDAAVASEPVADVVEDGWFETLALRLEDAYDAVEVEPEIDPEVERTDEQVVARFAFLAWNVDSGVSDAKAIADFVEGTYVQGVIPGYDYADPVAGLLSRATESAGGEDGGAERGGTPL